MSPYEVFACSNDCGRAAMSGHDLCSRCDEQALGDDEKVAAAAYRIENEERGFEGHGDFYSDDPMERWIAHQAAKGRL